MKIFYLFLIFNIIPLCLQKQFLKKDQIINNRKLASFDLETVRKNILENHNYHRKRHQVGSLVRSSDLESIAQSYSQTLASTGKFAHSGNKYNGDYMGENLYMSYGSIITGTDASQMWYDEKELYDFNNQGFSMDTGHFTQLVWKGSKQLGCGASCSNYGCYITCNYYPAGNYQGQFNSNVFPLKEGSDDSGSETEKETERETEKETESENKKQAQTLNEENGMSTAGKVFLSIFIILLILIIAFTVFHFAYKKRSFSEIKDYFKCLSNKR